MDMNTYMAAVRMAAAQMGLNQRDRIANWALGLAGEAGEAANKIKKVLYHGHELDLTEITRELGDVLWYVAVLATELDITLEDVARENVAKLERRYPNGFSSYDSQHRAT